MWVNNLSCCCADFSKYWRRRSRFFVISTSVLKKYKKVRNIFINHPSCGPFSIHQYETCIDLYCKWVFRISLNNTSWPPKHLFPPRNFMSLVYGEQTNSSGETCEFSRKPRRFFFQAKNHQTSWFVMCLWCTSSSNTGFATCLWNPEDTWHKPFRLMRITSRVGPSFDATQKMGCHTPYLPPSEHLLTIFFCSQWKKGKQNLKKKHEKSQKWKVTCLTQLILIWPYLTRFCGQGLAVETWAQRTERCWTWPNGSGGSGLVLRKIPRVDFLNKTVGIF